MSDHLAAAAQALGMPEAIVKRSAEARAKSTGSSVEDILEAWASGAEPPAGGAPAGGAAPAAPEPTPPPVEPAPPASAPAAPTPEAGVVAGAASPGPGSPAPQLRPVVPSKPPILVGRNDRPFGVMLGSVGLFVVFILTGFLGGVVPEEGNGVYTSQVVVSDAGKAGRDVYRSEGCAACHTQHVRPIVADAGLGPVTISDSNQVLGWRRYGPDLAHVGSRADTDLEGIVTGLGDHPSFAHLSDEDLSNLVAYLSESK